MISKDDWHKGKIPKTVLEVVADATINSIDFAQGRTVPLVILDTTNHPEIVKAIEVHCDVSNGNVKTTWGKTKDEKFISLIVELLDPFPAAFTIVFSAYPQAGIVDIIVSSQLLFIQTGKPGDRLKHDLFKPKLLIEVPSEQFASKWKELYLRIMTRRFRKLDYSKKVAEKLANDFYNEMRIVRDMRMKK